MRHGAGIVATAVLCGIASGGAAPWHWLDWVALVPWLLVLDRTTSWRAALASGAGMAAAFSVVLFSWFPVALTNARPSPGSRCRA